MSQTSPGAEECPIAIVAIKTGEEIVPALKSFLKQ
jgi:hypothetical protein